MKKKLCSISIILLATLVINITGYHTSETTLYSLDQNDLNEIDYENRDNIAAIDLVDADTNRLVDEDTDEDNEENNDEDSDEVSDEYDIAFEDCGSQYDIRSLRIGECKEIPCTLQIDTNVTVRVIFDYVDSSILKKTQEEEDFFSHKASWILNNVESRADIELKNTQLFDIGFNAVLKIGPKMPAIRGELQWISTTKQHKAMVLCFKVPVILKVPAEINQLDRCNL